jgi:hypothetical protein
VKKMKLRNALASVVAGVAFVVTGAVAASATVDPPVPDAGAATKQAASDLSNGLMSGFVDILPYAIPLLVLFTVVGYVIAILRTKRTAR